MSLAASPVESGHGEQFPGIFAPMDDSLFSASRFSQVVFSLAFACLPLAGGFSQESEVKPAPPEIDAETTAANIVLPQVEFVDTPLRDALEFLTSRSRELDVDEPRPLRRGVNIVPVGDYEDARINLRLSQLPLDATLQVVADLVDARVEARPEVMFIDRTDPYDVVRLENGSASLEMQLRRLVLPSVEFQDTPLRDAVQFLQQRSMELDTEEGGPRRGVNLVLKEGDSLGNISLSLSNTSLHATLEALALVSGLEVEIREHLVFLQPLQKSEGSSRNRRSSPPDTPKP